MELRGVLGLDIFLSQHLLMVANMENWLEPSARKYHLLKPAIDASLSLLLTSSSYQTIPSGRCVVGRPKEEAMTMLAHS